MDLLSQISFTLMDLLSEYVKKEKKEKRKKDWMHLRKLTVSCGWS